ncbi:MAG TPA: hypothetical protein VG963_33235, partial [Polyangiaceae bacterium]|nr:hypothetical protein [Polyangiaceae bacterium]
MRARAPNLALGLAFAVWLGQGGCAEPTPQIAWRFSFARQELATRARFVEAQVLGGGCAGGALFTTRVTLEAAGAEPDRLKPGRYGFRGRAQDTSCGWFAEGCREVVLPRSGAIDVVLNELPSQSLDLTCMAATGAGELDAGALPGAPPDAPPDRGAVLPEPTRPDFPTTTPLDAGEPTMLDAGAAPSQDAGEPPFDPRIPKCGALDQAVVACFDFDNTLADLSGHGNDAVGPAATFEPG